uniref:Uncharacterized protein n=1 Tax=Nothoprocta perdicaria TaxID=30464 RepID=A0A8C6YHP7_NOTPE
MGPCRTPGPLGGCWGVSGSPRTPGPRGGSPRTPGPRGGSPGRRGPVRAPGACGPLPDAGAPCGQVNYTQPVVAVQFLNATPNEEHHVECRLRAAGLRPPDERDKFAGRVAFRLRVNRQ